MAFKSNILIAHGESAISQMAKVVSLYESHRGRIIFQWKSPVSSYVRDPNFSLRQSLWYIIVCQSHWSHNQENYVKKYFVN